MQLTGAVFEKTNQKTPMQFRREKGATLYFCPVEDCQGLKKLTWYEMRPGVAFSDADVPNGLEVSTWRTPEAKRGERIYDMGGKRDVCSTFLHRFVYKNTAPKTDTEPWIFLPAGYIAKIKDEDEEHEETPTVSFESFSSASLFLIILQPGSSYQPSLVQDRGVEILNKVNQRFFDQSECSKTKLKT